MNTITSNLWFDINAEEAVKYYVRLFPNSKVSKTSYYPKEGFETHRMPEGTVMTIAFELDGQNFIALNGGPHFKFNPSVSFFVILKTRKEIDKLWNELSTGGQILMKLDKYDWSEKYGWIQDKFGLSWQLLLGDRKNYPQSISPSLLFTGRQKNKAESAIYHYSSIFKNSEIISMEKYGSEGPGLEGTVMFSQFKLNNKIFMAMDSPIDHPFVFNEAVSFIINCETQEEVDYYWTKLADGGVESMCGWLKDKFDISWQVVPNRLAELVGSSDREKSGRAMRAMLQMKKIVISDLEKAYNG